MVAVAAPVAIASGAAAGSGGFAALGGLGGVGSILSGLGSIGGMFGGKGSNFKGLRSQYDLAREYANKAFGDKMKFAEDYGISKLAMLGSPAIQTPAFSVGQQPLDGDMFGMGQGLQRAAAAMGDFADRQDQRRLAEIQLEGAQLDNDYKRQLIMSTAAAGTPPAMGAPSVVSGQGDGVMPRSIFVRDRDGKLTEVLNPDAGDNELMMAQDYFTRTLPNDLTNAASRSWNRLKTDIPLWLRTFFMRGRDRGFYRY